MSLVIVGSVALDSVSNSHGAVTDALGGSAVYAALAAAPFGEKVAIVAVVGDDFPASYEQVLIEKNIDLCGLQEVPGKTFRWIGRYDNMNEAVTLQTQLNVFADFCPTIPPDLTKSEYLFLGNIDPTLQLHVLDQMDAPRIVAADTMNFWITRKPVELRKLLSRIHILFINEEEIRMLTGKHDIFAAADDVLQTGPDFVVIKRGEYGAVARGKETCFFAPVFPTKKVVDTTGAGDSFAGGFMGYLSRKKEITESVLRQAIIYGTIISSFNIEGFSVSALKKITEQSLDQRYVGLKKYTVFD